MNDFKSYYLSLPLNKRINLKGKGAILNPWLRGECFCLGTIVNLQHLDISFARLVRSDNPFGDNRIFFTIDWSDPIRPAFDAITNTCPNHYGRSHSMYPALSFDYLNLGTCNH